MNPPILSVVIPAFNEQTNIQNSITRVRQVLTKAGISYEIIIIDDGSRDNTWQQITEIAQQHPGVKGLRLSRNFGKESALCAGLDLVQGDCCICLDADMQHPPEHIPIMYNKWYQEGFEVVEGVKTNRGKESRFYKLSAKLFYKILRRTSGMNLADASDFRLLDREALEAWRSMPEKQTFFRGMSSWIGFRRTQVEFDVQSRKSDSSKWSLSSLIKLAIQAVTSFTAAPLYASAFLGFGLLIAFFVLLIQTLAMKVIGYAADGFTTVIALQLVIGGSLLMSVGIIGIYIERIYDEVKNRPRYIVQKQVANPQDVQTHLANTEEVNFSTRVEEHQL